MSAGVPKVRQAFVLAGVTAAAIGVLAWTGWSEYESHSSDAYPRTVERGQTVHDLGAAWGPVELNDVTGLRDPEDPLPKGARAIEAVLPVDPDATHMVCRIGALAETPSRDAVEHRPGARQPRAWSVEFGAGLLDDVERSDSCDGESSDPAELRGVFFVPRDVSDDLVVSVDVTTDAGFETLRFLVSR